MCTYDCSDTSKFIWNALAGILTLVKKKCFDLNFLSLVTDVFYDKL